MVKSLLAECYGLLKRYEKGNLRDAALLVCLQRLEHYRVAGHSTTLVLAKKPEESEFLDFLIEAASRGDLTVKLLAQIAIQVDAEALIDTHQEKCVPTLS